MAIFKVEKNKNYTVMSNHHLQDKNLSYKAKGLLSFMLSLPENWDYSMNGLCAISKENIYAIRSILHELENNGYLIRERIHNEKGHFDYDYSIFELPYQQPSINLSHTVETNTNNHIQITTNKTNTELKDKIDKTLHPIVKELIKREFLEIHDLQLYHYESLFQELLENYDYQQIIISTNYIIQKWKTNKGLDMDNSPIQNKFGYFKTSLFSNLTRFENQPDELYDFEDKEMGI